MSMISISMNRRVIKKGMVRFLLLLTVAVTSAHAASTDIVESGYGGRLRGLSPYGYSQGMNPVKVGGSGSSSVYHDNMILIFALPERPLGGFQDADTSLTLTLALNDARNTDHNPDLWAIGYVPVEDIGSVGSSLNDSGTTDVDDYWLEAETETKNGWNLISANTVKLWDDLAGMTTPVDTPMTTPSSANSALTTFINNLYTSHGASAGDYLVLRINDDYRVKYSDWDFYAANTETEAYRPLLALSVEDGTPSFSDLNASNVTVNAATLSALLTGTNANVTAYWDADSVSDPASHSGWTGSNGPSIEATGIVTRAVSGLSADTLYSYAFYGSNTVSGLSVWSPVATFATDLTALQTPAFTNDAVATFNSVTLEWTDNAATETGYVLQRSTNNVEYVVVAELDAGDTTHTDLGLMSETTYYYQLAATNNVNESSTAFSACVTNATTLYLPPVTTYAGETGNYDKDTWNNAANWDNGIPSASQNAIIDVGEYASVSKAYSGVDTPAYTGNLTLSTNATLEIGSGATAADLNAMGGGTIYFNSGSLFKNRYSEDSTHSQNIVMVGDATYAIGSSTSAQRDNRTHTGTISGPGKLNVRSTRGQRLTLAASNTWSGGIVMGGALSADKDESLEGSASGAFGTGDVTVDDGVGLVIGANDTTADTATLSLSGRDGEMDYKLTMTGSDTVNLLTVDGFNFPAGTYGKTGHGSVDYEYAWIGGNNILTVSSEPADSSDPVLLTITDDFGSGVLYYELDPVVYTLTFNEAMSNSVTTADFDNAGTALVTIDSVTQTALDEFKVVVRATGTGTLILRAKASASFHDLFGNALTGPISDDNTIAVEAALPPETLLYDDFESGWGNWLDGGGDASIYTGSTYARQGANAINLQDNSGVASSTWLTNPLPLDSGEYTSLNISFWCMEQGMQSTHHWYVHYSDDNGATWQQILDVRGGSHNNIFTHYSISLVEGGTYTFTDQAKFKFWCNSYYDSHEIFLDQILITALPIVSPKGTVIIIR